MIMKQNGSKAGVGSSCRATIKITLSCLLIGQLLDSYWRAPPVEFIPAQIFGDHQVHRLLLVLLKCSKYQFDPKKGVDYDYASTGG